MKNYNFLVWTGTAIFIAGLLNVFLVKGDLMLILDNVLRIAFTIVLSWIIILCYKSVEGKFKEEKRAWFFFSSAVVFMLLGSIIRAFYNIALKIDVPAFSMVDLAWTASYLSAIIGLAYKIKGTYYNNKSLVSVVILAVCTLLAGIYAASKIEVLFSSLNVLFIVLDIYVIGLIFILVVPLFEGYNKVIKSYIWVLFAFLLFIIVDILDNVGPEGVYKFSTISNLLAYLARLSFIYGAYIKYKIMNIYKADENVKAMKRRKR